MLSRRSVPSAATIVTQPTGLGTGSIWFCERSVDATNNMSAESLRSGLIYLASMIKLPDTPVRLALISRRRSMGSTNVNAMHADAIEFCDLSRADCDHQGVPPLTSIICARTVPDHPGKGAGQSTATD